MDKGKNIKELIDRSSKVLIVSHTRPTVDSIASILLTWHFLNVGFKKKIDIYIPKFPERLEFLLKYSMLTLENIQKDIPNITYQFKIPKENGNIEYIKYTNSKDNYIFHINMEHGFINQENITLSKEPFSYDLIIAIDTPDIKFLGKLYKTYKNDMLSSNINIINIDSHINNQNYGDINVVSNNFNSTAQIVFRILSSIISLVSQKEYHLLLLGILSNTLSLHSENITQDTFEDIQNILAENINVEIANMELTAPSNIDDLKIKTDVLNNTKILQYKKSQFLLSVIEDGDIKLSYLNDMYINGAIATCIITNKSSHKIYLKPFTVNIQQTKLASIYPQYKSENGIYIFKSEKDINDIVSEIQTLF